MLLDERLAQDLKDKYQQLLADGYIIPIDQLQQYYDTFRERFGPERLANLDGAALLNAMHDLGNRDSLGYWLEFKNDEEFRTTLFGSIAGGIALKFGIYKSAQSGQWLTGTSQKQQVLSVDEAVAIARRHRAQLFAGLELLDTLPPNATDDEYRKLQDAMDDRAPDVSRLAWGHKYFSLLYPDKLDDYHSEHFQRFHLIKMFQIPPEGSGRYLCAGLYVAIAHQLDMPLNHLTAVLNAMQDKPYRYWRIGTNLGEGEHDIWPDMRDGNFIAIGWEQVGDLVVLYQNTPEDYEDFVARTLAEHYPNTKSVITRKAREVRQFANVSDYSGYLMDGDVVLAANGETILGIGRIVGGYQYVPGTDFPHRRPVEWLLLEEWKLPEREGLRTTVYELKRHPVNLVEVERRIYQRDILPPPPSKLKEIPARIQSILERKGQVILYGPPGTGKTYWAETAARELAARSVFDTPFEALDNEQKASILSTYVRLCSFHPSYGYEDFLEGYRPEIVNEQMTFERRDGIFKQLCQAAAADPERNYYLIIDEINRGDIPRIFGELLTVIEKDKRGKAVLLPLSNEAFRVPKNVYLIGTMNTADRSIALLDTALRRRFGFLELMPDYQVLGDTTVEGVPLAPWLKALNKRIVEHVGRDARNLQIGHAYLLHDGKPVTSFARFARMVQEDIIPLLEEYCYEDYDTLEKILGNNLVDGHSQTIHHDLFAPARQDELVQALLAPAPDIITSRQAVAAAPVLEDDETEEENGGDGDA
ncbi:MAG: AAA domain-containing protein [Chloroflexi bacterium]|nr:AAA domain-containing protein [Chloroflexota bacterium]